MTRKKRTRWAPGVVYAVPLTDGSYGVAQAVDAMMVNVIYVALFRSRLQSLPDASPSLSRSDVVALTATWRRDLENGDWPVLGSADLAVEKAEFPNERFASKGYIGAKHFDAELLAEFLSAYHGLLPWNVSYEEDAYDQMLAPGICRPDSAIVLDPEARNAYRIAQGWQSAQVT